MHIAQVTNNIRPADRLSCGSVGAHVGLLTDSLHELGHEVVLYGEPQSNTKAELVGVPTPALECTKEELDKAVSTVIDVALPAAQANKHDIVHNHIEPHRTSLEKLRELSKFALTCSVLHKDPDASTQEMLAAYPFPFIAISHAQAHRLNLNWVGVVHYGIDTDVLRPKDSDSPKDKALVIGRIEEGKGVHTAIESSLRAGFAVDVAGGVSDRSYFNRQIAPLLTLPGVRYLGMIAGEAKRRAYAEAAVTVTASSLPETSCLVLAESMSCGTPAVALAKGACPEVIDQGVSGCIVEDPKDLAEGIAKAVTLDPEIVRGVAVRRFGLARMALEYSRIYQSQL